MIHLYTHTLCGRDAGVGTIKDSLRPQFLLLEGRSFWPAFSSRAICRTRNMQPIIITGSGLIAFQLIRGLARVGLRIIQ
jgi:hypothetical protein